MRERVLLEKYRLPLTLGLATVLFFVSVFWAPAIFIAAGFMLTAYIFSDIDEIFAYSFYFMLFSGVIVFYITLAVGTFVIVFIKYIVDARRGRVRVYKLPLIVTTVFTVITALIHYKVNSYGFFQGLLIIGLLYICYVIFCYRDKLSVEKMFNSMFAGMVVSIILSLILYNIRSAKVFVFDDFDYGFASAHDIIFLIAGKFKRLAMFSYHPNHLASFCMFELAYAFSVLINVSGGGKWQKLQCLSMIAVSTVIGFLTLSKAFFIIFVSELIFVLITLAVHYKKKSLPYLIAAGVVLATVAAIFYRQIGEILERLLPNHGSNTLNDITTGRVDIWKKFIDELSSNRAKFVFGVGLFTTDAVDIGPHSFYLALIYRFGLVGIVGLGAVIMSYFRVIDTKKSLGFGEIMRRSLPLLVFAIYSVQEANLDERFFFLVTAVLLLWGFTGIKTKDAANYSEISQDDGDMAETQQSATDSGEPRDNISAAEGEKS